MVPFLFATNGRPYLKQLEQKSGIWFLDGRESTNHPRPLQAWYTPQGLLDLFQQDARAAKDKLKKEPFDYLDLRDYQVKAIQKVEESLSVGKRSVLLAMATGTGKTMVAIGLVYRFIKSGCVNGNIVLFSGHEHFKRDHLYSCGAQIDQRGTANLAFEQTQLPF